MIDYVQNRNEDRVSTSWIS